MNQQWPPRRSVGCRVPVGRKNKTTKSSRIPGALPHSSTTWLVGQERWKEGGSFYKCSLEIKYRCAALGYFTLPVCPELPLSQMCLWRCSWRVEFFQPGSRCGLLIWTVLVRFLHPPWQDGVFAQRGLGRDKAWNSNSTFLNIRRLRKKGVRVSLPDDWTGMSSSLQCILIGLFRKLNVCCDNSGSCSQVCVNICRLHVDS